MLQRPILPSAATDAKRQKQGSYLQGKREGTSETKLDIAKAMLALGKLSVAEIAQAAKLTEAEVLALKDS
ncbi:MAG: hypothetical protein MJZ22_04005 [Candidatus Saccharibacteria bacterium]|nr:hypothetical protein [Candidatus Saccharibacteria bacterium]